MNFLTSVSPGGMESIMSEPTVLRETGFGQKGYNKEDVLTYLDELNTKIVSLEDELKNAKESGASADPQEIIKTRNQMENLQEKLNNSNNALRAAKKENEELKKKIEEDQKLINQLKAGGPGASAAAAQANAQTAAALEAAKKEIDNLKNQLKAAEAKSAGGANAQANAQSAAALEAAKKEIDALRTQLKAAEAKGGAAVPAGKEGAELAKAKQEIAKLTSDLNAKSKELADKTAALEAKSRESSDNASKVNQVDSLLASKDTEIAKLKEEIEDLKENGGNIIPSSFDMGALFTEAQKTAGKITIEAQKNADKVTREANAKAEQILKDANSEAERTIANANTTAEACIKEANDQAKATVDDANSHADKVNAMSATVRSMLLNEIDSVNTKFNDITSVLTRLTNQATDRMSEAQLIVGEAKKTIDTADNGVIKKGEAPKADFKPTEAPKASLSDLSSVSPAVLNSKNDSLSGSNSNSYSQSNNKPAQAPAQEQQKQAQPSKKNNFSFDMAELLKAAEEEAAKNPES